MNICEQDKDNVALFNVNLNLHMYTLAQQILKQWPSIIFIKTVTLSNKNPLTN